MDDSFIERLRFPVSNARLESYGSPDEDDETRLLRYFWNIELSQALYPILQAFEVSLRNALHHALTIEKATAQWYDIPGLLGEQQTEKVAEVVDDLTRQGKDVTPDRIVSRLMFGFWTSLLNRPYEETLWHTGTPILLTRAFPHLPKHKRTRKSVYGRVQLANTIRNRVFHYEAIWNRPHLLAEYGHILEALGWISPEIVEVIMFYDRFDVIHHRGLSYNTIQLKIHLDSKDAP